MTHRSRRIFLAHAAAAIGLSGCWSGRTGDHLSVFDTVWRIIDEWYFDPTMEGIDWKSVRREWRPKAAKAQSQAALYLEVLVPMLELFRASHVDIRPPKPLMLSDGQRFRLPVQKKGQAPLFMTAADEAALGAVLTWTGAAFVVEDVAPSGIAHRAGLRIGQTVRQSRFSVLSADRRKIDLIDAKTNRVWTLEWTTGAPPARTEQRRLGVDLSYVRFDTFDVGSVEWARTWFSAATSGAVVDLRRNTGGQLREMWRLVSMLLPHGAEIGIFRTRKKSSLMTAGEVALRFEKPLAVLIGPRTTSAAEIMAAALQDNQRARLFGTQSSGSVLASQRFVLPDGGNLSVPFADYFRKSGRRIEGAGVVPDLVQAHTAARAARGRDPALDVAQEWLASQ